MGQYKKQGDNTFALMEECGEVIQVISKLFRFGGEWDEIPPGDTKTRWQKLESEMADVMYHWKQLKETRKFETDLVSALKSGLKDEFGDLDIKSPLPHHLKP